MKKMVQSTVLRTVRGTITVINKSQLTYLKKIFPVFHHELLEYIGNLYNTKSTLLQKA